MVKREYDTPDGKTEMQRQIADERTSAWRKYLDINVGGGIGLFFIYEFYTFFLSPLPGALGYFLRKLFAPWVFAKCGSGVAIGRNVTVRHPRKIRLGDGVIIDDYAVLDAKGTENAGIDLGSGVIIGRNTVLSCKDGSLTVGKNSNIAMGCFIQSAAEVSIGENCLFAAFCYVIGGGDHKSDRTDIPVIAQGQVVLGIAIADNVWAGAGVKILDGVRVGRDAILGAGSIVRNDVPDWSVAVGIPAKTIRSRLPGN